MNIDLDVTENIFTEAWNGFAGTEWKGSINVRDFIQNNYTP